MLADELDYVVGVDTHRDEHVLAVVAAATGAVLARRALRANAGGYSAALRFAEEAAGGARAWAVEGTGSYGAGLARYLAERGENVLEASRTPRTERRLRGKDDALDAVRTARAALAGEELALPRNGKRREALRLLLVARRSAVDVRREALGQLRGIIVTAPDRLREELRVLPTGRLLERCSRLRSPRRRRPAPRLERPDETASAQPRRRSAAQPRPAHRRPASPPARPGYQELHRQTHRRREEPTRRHPVAQALSRPPPLPATAKRGAASGLTGHRSFIREL